jgi:hypothetical protein
MERSTHNHEQLLAVRQTTNRDNDVARINAEYQAVIDDLKLKITKQISDHKSEIANHNAER